MEHVDSENYFSPKVDLPKKESGIGKNFENNLNPNAKKTIFGVEAKVFKKLDNKMKTSVNLQNTK